MKSSGLPRAPSPTPDVTAEGGDGQRAKPPTSALVIGKDVILQAYGKDKYERTLSDVLLPDGTHDNHELVKDHCGGGIGSMRLRIPC